MSAIDYDKDFRCPTCHEPGTARMRRISAHQGIAYNVIRTTCPNGCTPAKDVVRLAAGICPHCGRELRSRPSIEPSVAGGERDLVCSSHGVVGPDAW